MQRRHGAENRRSTAVEIGEIVDAEQGIDTGQAGGIGQRIDVDAAAMRLDVPGRSRRKGEPDDESDGVNARQCPQIAVMPGDR